MGGKGNIFSSSFSLAFFVPVIKNFINSCLINV